MLASFMLPGNDPTSTGAHIAPPDQFPPQGLGPVVGLMLPLRVLSDVSELEQLSHRTSPQMPKGDSTH